MFLTKEELIELTGRKTRPAQVMMLRSLGMEHRVRADGAVVVLRGHVEQVLGLHSTEKPKEREVQINWDAIR